VLPASLQCVEIGHLALMFVALIFVLEVVSGTVEERRLRILSRKPRGERKSGL
jgi:hypothetical protein